MPTYDYICKHCGKELEIIQKITADPLTLCEACGQNTLHRRPGGGIGLSFKGSGFYITDYGPRKPQKEKASTKTDEKTPSSKE